MTGLMHDLRCLFGAWLLEAASNVLPKTDTAASARHYLVRAVTCLEHELEQDRG